MFNVGGGEVLVILIAALIVLGPDKLPNAARQVGKYLAEFRKISQGFQDELRGAMDITNMPDTEPVAYPPAEPADAPVAGTPVADTPVADTPVADTTSPAAPADAESQPSVQVDHDDSAPDHSSDDAAVAFEMPATMVPTTMAEAAPVEEAATEDASIHDAGPTGPTAA